MRALIIDDARAMRLILRQVLQKLGFEVAEACDGAAGLQQLRASARPDVVFVDCHMPIMDGLAFIRAVRADGDLGSLPLIMVSAENEQAQIARALEAGADDCLVKPFDKEMVRARLRHLELPLGQS